MTGPGDVVAREVVAHGRVQGVLFRDTCRAEARAAGVTGWVRNEPDGSVRMWFEGVEHRVDDVVRWARSGPRRARVLRLDVDDREPAGHRTFEVLL